MGQHKRIAELDTLRGFSILLIFLDHALGGDCGISSVAFFFMLSGFAHTLGYAPRVTNGQRFPYGAFLKKRLSQQVPLHWAMMLATAALFPYLLKATPEFACVTAANLLLLQSFVPDPAFYFGYNPTSWYLSAALVSTALFPFIIRFLTAATRRGKALFLAAALLAYAAIALAADGAWKHGILHINPLTRLADFVLGIYLALLYQRLAASGRAQAFARRHDTWLSAAAICALLLAAGLPSLVPGLRLYAAIYWLPVAAAILYFALKSHWGLPSPLMASRPLVWFGGINFEFYMTHMIVIRTYNAAMAALGVNPPPPPVYLSTVIIFITTVLVSVFCKRYFVEPLSRWILRKSPTYTTAA